MPESSTPDRWRKTNLADLGEYVNGFAFNESYWSTEGLPIVRIAQITGSQGIVDRYKGTLPDSYRLEEGDIVFSWSGTLAVVRWSGGPAWLNQHLFKVVPRNGVDADLLFHLLQASVAEMDKRTHGSTMKHIKRGELVEFNVLLPNSPDEQAQLARVLDTLDTTIRQTEAIIEKLKQVKQGLLHDLLTRGIADNGELRPPQSEAPQLYKKSALGWIPKEWDCSNVTDEFNVTSGITLGPHRTPRLYPRKYLRVANVQRAGIDLSDVAELEASDAEITSRRLEPGDLLVVEGHASVEEIGRCAMANEAVRGFTFQNHLFRLRAIRLDHVFGLLWMNSAFVRAYWCKEAATSSGLNTINRAKLARVSVAVPTLVEQQQVAAIAEAMNQRVNSEARQMAKLVSLKSGLMDDLLTGRVRVTPLLQRAPA